MNDPILDHAKEYYRLRALQEDLLYDDEISVDDPERYLDARQALELKLLLAERRLISTRPTTPEGLETLLIYALQNAGAGEVSEALKTALECVSECCVGGQWTTRFTPADDSLSHLRSAKLLRQ
jgi:hypothetical protein